MKDDKFSPFTPNLQSNSNQEQPVPDPDQEAELTEEQLDEVAGGAFGLAAGDKDFDKKKLDLNLSNRTSNPAELLPYIRSNTSRG